MTPPPLTLEEVRVLFGKIMDINLSITVLKSGNGLILPDALKLLRDIELELLLILEAHRAGDEVTE